MLASTAVLAGILVSTPARAEACGNFSVRLAELAYGEPVESVFNPVPGAHFYWAAEGSPSVGFTIVAFGHDCTGQQHTASFATGTGTATSGQDYQARTGTTPQMEVQDIDPEYWSSTITLLNDAVAEPAVEYVPFSITASGANIVSPWSVPVYLVDDDGLSRVSLPPTPTSYTVGENVGTWRIPVFRAGDASASSGTITVSATHGTTDDADFSISPSSFSFGPGQRKQDITVTIVDDKDDEADSESFTVSISGTQVEAPSSVTMNILDNDLPPGSDTAAPKTWFHHPKHKKDYAFGSLKARTIHVFAPTEDVANKYGPAEPSGIDKVQAALKRKKTSGKCQWWTASRTWKGGKCGSPKWFKLKFDFKLASDRYLYVYDLLTDLKPSKGTKVKFYQVWSRAQDGAGNWESTFEVGRNKNRFEINKKK